MKKNSLILVLLLLICTSVFAQDELPIRIPDTEIKSLPSLYNKSLQTNLEKELQLISESFHRKLSKQNNSLEIISKKIDTNFKILYAFCFIIFLAITLLIFI